MAFAKRFQEIISRTAVPSERKLLLQSHLFAFLVFLLLFAVLYVLRPRFSLFMLNRGIAWTAVILISLSFALSAICYFWNFADTKIIYRKHLGVAGYHYGIIHFLFSLYVISRRNNIFEYFANNENYWPAVFGSLALIYFAFMTFVSDRYMVHELGGHRWRILLRIGYIALFLVLIHVFLSGWPNWLEWLSKKTFPPPIGLVFFVLTVSVFILRGVLELHVRLKKRSTPVA